MARAKLRTLLCAGLLCVASSAAGQTITYQFTGTIDSLTPHLTGAFVPGDTLSGTVVFDPGAAGTPCPSGNCAEYNAPTLLLTATIGAYTVSGRVAIFIGDDAFGNGFDQYALSARSTVTTLTPPTANGYELMMFQLNLVDNSATALNGVALVPPVLSAYDQRRWHLYFKIPPGGPLETIAVSGELTALVSPPACDVQLSAPTYQDGDTVTAQVLRFANPAAGNTAIETKLFLETTGAGPFSLWNFGADGSVVLPPAFDLDLGPVPIFNVTSVAPRGDYRLGCRLLNPVTGALLAEDLNDFTIQ